MLKNLMVGSFRGGKGGGRSADRYLRQDRNIFLKKRISMRTQALNSETKDRKNLIYDFSFDSLDSFHSSLLGTGSIARKFNYAFPGNYMGNLHLRKSQ